MPAKFKVGDWVEYRKNSWYYAQFKVWPAQIVHIEKPGKSLVYLVHHSDDEFHVTFKYRSYDLQLYVGETPNFDYKILHRG